MSVDVQENNKEFTVLNATSPNFVFIEVNYTVEFSVVGLQYRKYFLSYIVISPLSVKE